MGGRKIPWNKPWSNLTIYIISVTLNTKLDTLWLCRVCAKTTSLNLVKPFAYEILLTSGENDATYSLIIVLRLRNNNVVQRNRRQ